LLTTVVAHFVSDGPFPFPQQG